MRPREQPCPLPHPRKGDLPVVRRCPRCGQVTLTDDATRHVHLLDRELAS